MIQTRQIAVDLTQTGVKLNYVSTKEVDVSAPKPKGDVNKIVKGETTKSVTTSDIDQLKKDHDEAKKAIQEKVRKAAAAKRKKAKT